MTNGEILESQFRQLGLPVHFVKEEIFFKLVIYYFDMENVARFSQKSIENMLKKISIYNQWDYNYYPTHETHFAVSTQAVGNPKIDLAEIGRGAVGLEMGKGDFYFDWNSVKHLLVAGTTGAGKSVFLNSFIYSILTNFDYKLGVFIVDLKKVGFTYWVNKGCKVYTEMPQIEQFLKDACYEMEQRYTKLAKNPSLELQPLFIIIDELADLMLNKKYKCEEYIIRLAQKSRGANMHLVLATQRPTVNVVNGLIKANCDTRVCLKVASVRDSVVMLDHKGAELLNGNGDCLIKLPNDFKEKRVQIAYHEWA